MTRGVVAMEERPTDGASGRRFVAVLARGFDILRAFQPGGGALGNQELSHATGIPRPRYRP